MKNAVLFFFFCCTCLGQNRPIEITIDTITSVDSIPTERIFVVKYHIENTTEKEVSFFLNPKVFTPNSRASMSRSISYKIYRDQELIDIDAIFINRKKKIFDATFEKAKTEAEKEALFKKFYLNNADFKTTFSQSESDKMILNDILTFQPHEKKSLIKTLIWDKKRYYKIDDVEYYLDEKINHYFELSINLMQEEFKEKLSDEAFRRIMNDKSFIKGWFTSNKVEINFKD